MKRFLACILSVVIATGLAPASAIAGDGGRCALTSAGMQAAQDAITVPEAHPEAVTGATAPANETAREKVYVEDFREHVDPHHYGPSDEGHTDDGTVIETAMAAAEGKTLVFEKGRTYTFGTYPRSNAEGIWGRSQGIHLNASDVIIEGNGATLLWDDKQVFVNGDGLVLEGTMTNPIHDIVIRNLNFSSVNNSRTWTDPLSGKTFKNNNLVQLKGLCCENVLVENCTFTATPNPDEALHAQSDAEGRGVTNIWFYGGAKNVTVRNCTLRDITCGSQESGSNLLFSGECEWKRSKDDAFQKRYDALTTEEQYQLICDEHLQGRIENILVEGNTFEHACHDESLSIWCAEVFKDILVQGNVFDVHDGDAHVPSTVNFTFGLPAHHDRLENVVLTHNDIYTEASWAAIVSRADMGGDLHVTGNDLHFNRVKLDRKREPNSAGEYVYSTMEDRATTNGLMYAAYNKDYVDFSGNRVTYDNDDGGKGLMNLMGAKNLLCEGNQFIANGPLSHLAVLWASDVSDAAGHESIFKNNTFDINGTLDKALLRGGFHFTDNVVRLNGSMTGNSLFCLFGNISGDTNNLYTLHDDVDISGNKVFMKTALPEGLSALYVYDASFAGHVIHFTSNELWSTVDQASGNWPLVRAEEVQGETPTMDATGTTSNLFNKLSFYRTSESEEKYASFQGTLTYPRVLVGNQEYTATKDHRTLHELSTEPYSGTDPDETAPNDKGPHAAAPIIGSTGSRVRSMVRESTNPVASIGRAGISSGSAEAPIDQPADGGAPKADAQAVPEETATLDGQRPEPAPLALAIAASAALAATLAFRARRA